MRHSGVFYQLNTNTIGIMQATHGRTIAKNIRPSRTLQLSTKCAIFVYNQRIDTLLLLDRQKRTQNNISPRSARTNSIRIEKRGIIRP